MKKNLTLLWCLSIPLIIGAISGIATSKSINTWYATLNKPFFNPPNYLFGPVWTALYLLMGVSLFLVLQHSEKNIQKKHIVIFSVQLFLNFIWSYIFFKFHNIGLALLEMLILWISILILIINFYKTNKWAGLLNIPYLLWVSFASILTAAIWLIN